MTRPLRKDALRSREQIIAAARNLFASRGISVGYNEIAHHAGVGVGTIYRRFPDKAELIAAVVAEPVAEIYAVADQAAKAERAIDGVAMLLRSGARLLTANLGLRDLALGTGDIWEMTTQFRDHIQTIGRELLQRALAEGDIRPGITTEDFNIIFWMVSELARHASKERPDAYERYLEIFIEGMRNHENQKQLRSPLTENELALIQDRWSTIKP